jgi:hypothetical protein
VNRKQLIEFCAEACFQGWAAEENQRRRELRAKRNAEMGQPITNVTGLPLDVPSWGGLSSGDREVWFARARPMVLALERENALRVGSERLYDVQVDDPDLARMYEWRAISAFSARAAAWEGARRTVEADPLDFLRRQVERQRDAMPFPDGQSFPPPYSDRLALESPALVEAVAFYARVRPARSDAPWVEGDALWLGY